MELKLNIYSKERNEDGTRKIEKTYTSNTCDILYAPIEDMLNVLDLETENIKNEQEMLKLIVSMISQIKPILMDVFYGLTAEELRYASLKEVAKTTFDVIQYGISEIVPKKNGKN